MTPWRVLRSLFAGPLVHPGQLTRADIDLLEHVFCDACTWEPGRLRYPCPQHAGRYQ